MLSFRLFGSYIQFFYNTASAVFFDISTILTTAILIIVILTIAILTMQNHVRQVPKITGSLQTIMASASSFSSFRFLTRFSIARKSRYANTAIKVAVK